MSNNDGSSRRAINRAPKVGHKKSRKGCQTCKDRRVKCDETYPTCKICLRLGLECAYAHLEQPQPRPPTSAKASPDSRSSSSYVQSMTDTGGPASILIDSVGMSGPSMLLPPIDPEVLESKQRRFMELRLLHHWIIHVSYSFGMTSPPSWRELWNGEVPEIALAHDNVLYALFAMSATHLLGRHPNDSPLARARQDYWVWALSKQRAAVANLSDSNIDAASFAALLITMNALAMVQERSLEPYEPPMEWLEVGRGAFSVLPNAENVAADSKLKILIETTAPIWQSDKTLDPEDQAELGAVLDQTIGTADGWDDETREGYEMTLSYIASFRRAIQAGDAADISLRWICMFPFMVPTQFVDFVREKRPRALVMLAYFFALIAQTDALKYLGNTGEESTAKREICSIRSVLPAQWHPLMAWPLREVGCS